MCGAFARRARPFARPDPARRSSVARRHGRLDRLYSPHGRRSRAARDLVCPECKTPVRLVKDGAGLKCDTCHRVYPIKDDIPVMLIDEARSRTDRVRDFEILLVRLRLIGDVVFTTPVIRALRRRYPAAQLTYLVEPAPPRRRRQSASLRSHRRPAPRGWRRVADDFGSRGAARAAIRRGDRSARRAAQRVAHLGEPGAVRVGYDIRAGRGCTRMSCTGRANCARGTRSKTSGTCCAVDPAFAEAAGSGADRVEMPVDPAARAASTRGCRPGLPPDARLVVCT